MFERPQPSSERVILVHIFQPSLNEEDLKEFKELALSAGANVAQVITGSRTVPDPKYFIGRGKAEEIRLALAAHGATLVLFNHVLSPTQERNLEQLFQCRVLDRHGLILDIFAQRARTFEGKLQVELALLEHISTRLVRGWTHLERQKGGIGLRGPGETQLEVDRRLIRNRIKTIRKRLEKVKAQRQQNRETRLRRAIPTVALVGYTNAGKSSLFNRLTQAETLVANQLFATLDPTLRRLDIIGAGTLILADTVGFIRNLPPELVEAFSATLEETREADLLLHVIDVADPERSLHIEQVAQVLSDIGAADIPTLYVYNKIDLQELPPRIEVDNEGIPKAIWVSAARGEGISYIHQALQICLFGEPIRRQICLTHQEGQLRAQLYKLGAVEHETIDEKGHWLISICLSKQDFERLFPPDLDA